MGKKRRVSSQDFHDQCLDRLVYHLDDVNENPAAIAWILKDGVWMPNHSARRLSLCDLICVYYNHTATPIELKGSRGKRSKAKQQVDQGYKFIEEMLKMQPNPGKIVYYTHQGYNWEYA